ncbi:aldo/keto reductase [Pectobacterium quasiaquaticum]|uniref:Aldo/keto reductase n=1 Tax=Pectobacterium quasiaquaticum TaxID=2774015 RepID=A0A9Q2ENZ2_9GAMM|nr:MULTISPECIES: aldo/keto reductase [Pectobacterium]MBE5215671.1 aldo/keto reductase [Pectobacterium quasiaquaticum]MBE5220972.1 aldo/keto reductase [Pectobacterium quasiaquaticum]MBE5225940.1 aldo/keto reductase [Pectobacterium quasiaquaticum]MBN3063164.1 aldo/keto reductase [Pectobacterium aquaticum]URG49947.1 aldo/keto reductase [Pectobacterium quasiaquaticum]
MKYTTFGRNTGLRVSELALGTGNFGTGWGYGSEKEQAKQVFDRYANAGGNFIDTADAYQLGQSEQMVGEFIAADRDHFVVATKYTLSAMPDAGISQTGNSRKNMLSSVENSLKRLKTDRIDMLWAHFDDQLTPLEEIVRAFDDLVRAGKIQYAGLSNFPAWRIARADTIAELRGWSRIAGIQVEYSLVQRTAERELLPMAEAMGLAATLWSPLGGGLLTGKYRKSKEGRLIGFGGRLVHTEQDTTLLDEVFRVANDLNVMPIQIAIAWLRYKSARASTSLIPILGSRTLAQLDDTLLALNVTLSDEQVERLDEVSAISLGTPHDQIAGSLPRAQGGDSAHIITPWPPRA